MTDRLIAYSRADSPTRKKDGYGAPESSNEQIKKTTANKKMFRKHTKHNSKYVSKVLHE